jgi:type I site-specific restriction endonuclease
MPPLDATGLWSVQATAITNLEKSLHDDRPRALIQMATGSGKTFTAANVAFRLIRHADAKRILFLVDRSTLGKQTKLELWEVEALGQARVVALVRDALDERMPEPLFSVLEREDAERATVEAVLREALGGEAA